MAQAGENEETHARRLELQRPLNAAAASNKRANLPKDVDVEWFHCFCAKRTCK